MAEKKAAKKKTAAKKVAVKKLTEMTAVEKLQEVYDTLVVTTKYEETGKHYLLNAIQKLSI